MDEKAYIGFLNARGLNNPSTLKEYVRGFKDLDAYFQGNIPKKGRITQHQVDILVGQIKARYKTNSQIPRLMGLKWTLRYLGYIKDGRDVFRVSIPSSVETMRESVLTPEQVQLIFDYTKDEPFRNAICKMFYYTGIRRMELSGLNLEDIDFENQVVHIQNGKGQNHQPDTIAISPIALDALQKYLKMRQPENPEEKALFLSPIGRRVSKSYLNYMMKELRAETGLPRLTCHIWRASLITHLSNNGASLYHIKAQSRHKSDKVLGRYIRPSIDDKKRLYNQFCPQIDTPQQSKPVEPPKPVPPKIEPSIPISIDTRKEELIKLLQEGLITPEQFRECFKSDNSKTSRYIQ